MTGQPPTSQTGSSELWRDRLCVHQHQNQPTSPLPKPNPAGERLPGHLLCPQPPPYRRDAGCSWSLVPQAGRGAGRGWEVDGRDGEEHAGSPLRGSAHCYSSNMQSSKNCSFWTWAGGTQEHLHFTWAAVMTNTRPGIRGPGALSGSQTAPQRFPEQQQETETKQGSCEMNEKVLKQGRVVPPYKVPPQKNPQSGQNQ